MSASLSEHRFRLSYKGVLHEYLICLFCDLLTGGSSRDEEIQGGGGDNRGTEENDEDAGYQICGDEKGCRG